MPVRWFGVVVDAVRPLELGRWWALALDYRVLAEDDDECMIGMGVDEPPYLLFVRGNPANWGQNKLRLELAPDNQDAEINRLVGFGATAVEAERSNGATWVLLADPEGNVFSVLRGVSDEVA